MRTKALLGIVSLVSFTACGRSAAPENAETPIPSAMPGIVELSVEATARAGIKLAPVEERALSGELSTTGEVDYDQNLLAQVSTRLAGRVERATAELGQSVRAGQTLATIDSLDMGKAKAEFLQAKTRLELADKNRVREETLFEKKVSSEQSMLTARSAFEESRAGYEAAKEALRLYGLSNAEVDAVRYGDSRSAIFAVRAPFDGKVVEKHLTRGELVTPEKSLFTIADLRREWVWIDVYEQDLARVHPGDIAEVRVDAFPDRTYRGVVSYVRDEVDKESRTVRARIDVDNADGALRPRMFAKVQLTDPHAAGGAKSAPLVLVVPDAAVQRDGDAFLVFVLAGENNRYQRRVVAIGRRAGGNVEIRSGVAKGEKVVTEGSFVLKAQASKDRFGGEE